MPLTSFDDELAAHLAAAVFDLQAAVKGEVAGRGGGELEGGWGAGAGRFGEAVAVGREAVRDVFGVQLDADEIVGEPLDARRLELVALGGDLHPPDRRLVVLRTRRLHR